MIDPLTKVQKIEKPVAEMSEAAIRKQRLLDIANAKDEQRKELWVKLEDLVGVSPPWEPHRVSVNLLNGWKKADVDKKSSISKVDSYGYPDAVDPSLVPPGLKAMQVMGANCSGKSSVVKNFFFAAFKLDHIVEKEIIAGEKFSTCIQCKCGSYMALGKYTGRNCGGMDAINEGQAKQALINAGWVNPNVKLLIIEGIMIQYMPSQRAMRKLQSLFHRDIYSLYLDLDRETQERRLKERTGGEGYADKKIPTTSFVEIVKDAEEAERWATYMKKEYQDRPSGEYKYDYKEHSYTNSKEQPGKLEAKITFYRGEPGGQLLLKLKNCASAFENCKGIYRDDDEVSRGISRYDGTMPIFSEHVSLQQYNSDGTRTRSRWPVMLHSYNMDEIDVIKNIYALVGYPDCNCVKGR